MQNSLKNEESEEYFLEMFKKCKCKSVVLIHKIFMCNNICNAYLTSPLQCSLLQNATISKMKSDNFKTLQKRP
jgi:hypothetical protein